MVVKSKPFQVLNIWMEDRGVRQVDLANQLGVTRSAVNRWCKGVAAPSKEHAKNIAKISKGMVPEHIWVRMETTAGARGPQALREVVNKNLWSVAELGRRCGVPQRIIARYIAGQFCPPTERLQMINSALGLKLRAKDFARA